MEPKPIFTLTSDGIFMLESEFIVFLMVAPLLMLNYVKSIDLKFSILQKYPIISLIFLICFLYLPLEFIHRFRFFTSFNPSNEINCSVLYSNF